MGRKRFFIAQIGKTVGLRGDLKLHLYTDFPQQFRKGTTLQSSRGLLSVEAYDPRRGLIRFEGYGTPEEARRLTNAEIYSDEEQTRELCPLKEGEYYWFDLIGSEVVESGEVLGTVREIQRMLDVDYLLVETEENLCKKGMPGSFLIPYLPRYVLSVDTGSRKIETRDARDILEAS